MSLKVSGHQFHQFQRVCMGSAVSTSTSNSRTPVGCLKIQLNSDTTYPGKASNSYKTTPYPILGSSHKPRLLIVLLVQLAIKSEIQTTPSLESINLLEWLTKLRETFHLLDHQFITNE